MEEKKAEMFNRENCLHVYARNFPDFKELLSKAEKEAQQLHETVQKLSCFTFELEVTVKPGQDGVMEPASSDMRYIPTK